MSRKKTRARTRIRIFRCQTCGFQMPATKTWGMTHTGHVKHMWCPRCRMVVGFEQVEDAK